MKAESYYPPVPEDCEWFLEMVKEQLDNDPDYLSNPDCPYSAHLVELLGDRMSIEVEELEEIDLEKEARALYQGLKDTAGTLGAGDNTEKMAFYRTATSLMEKLIGFQERANNIKQVGMFYRTVMSVLEEFLTADQVTNVRDRLREYL